MSKRKGISRRRFVGDVTAAGLSFTIVPRHVLGRGYLAPSDKLNIGCVGGGGRAKDDIAGVSATENIYAIADPDWDNAGESFAKFPQAKKYKDYREMLDKEKSIDAVVIACPDHSHTPAALMALRAGKHVYCEKPLCRTLGEVRALMKAAAERPKLATQMGNQGHAGEGIRLIREWVEAGLIGTVREVHFWTDRPIWPQAIDRPLQEYYVPATLDWNLWLGPAPERPYHPSYEPFNWRGWWDFGTGALGDMACHIMDAAFWTLDLGSDPRDRRDHRAVQGDRTEELAGRVSLPRQGRAPRSDVRLAGRLHLSAAALRGRGWPSVATLRRRRLLLDRRQGQTDRRHVRRQSPTARSAGDGRGDGAPRAAEVPAGDVRLCRVDQCCEGEREGGLEL